MKTRLNIPVILIINLILSMALVWLSPRFDVLTLLGFLVIQGVIGLLLYEFKCRSEAKVHKELDQIFELLHHLDLEAENREVSDDIFGKLRDEIIKILVENKNLARRANENEQLLREYLEDIAHQIKTPMTGVMVMLDLMRESPQEATDYIDYVYERLSRLSRLADLLLEMASLESGLVKMKMDPIDVMALLEDAVSELRETVAIENLQIQLQGTDFVFRGDWRWIYEAVYNLAKNGLEASAEHGISIETDENQIAWSIYIFDYGAGMNRGELKKAYLRFHKATSHDSGYGIGLPMAKTIVEAHGGELIYRREKDRNFFEMRFYK